MRVDTTILGLSSDRLSKSYIASMGIYVFKEKSLNEALRNL